MASWFLWECWLAYGSVCAIPSGWGLTARRPGTWGFWWCCAGLWARRCSTSLMTGVDYSAHPSEIFSIDTLQAGGVFSGGLIAAFIAAAWYVRKHHMPALGTCDAFAPGLALGHAIGRIGCFAAGCCYGKETHHFWGVVFRNPLANSDYRDSAERAAGADAVVRVGGRAGEFLLSDVAA